MTADKSSVSVPSQAGRVSSRGRTDASARPAPLPPRRPEDAAFSRAALLLIAIACVLAFLPVTRNEFVDWDDLQVLATNTQIRGLSAGHLGWMMTTAHMAQWQPLGWFLFALQYEIFGPDARSFASGLHVVNLLLHTAAALLCFLVIRRLLSFRAGHAGDGTSASQAVGASHGSSAGQAVGAIRGASATRGLESAPSFALALSAMLGALFFALHPLRVEVVAWATAQPYLWAFLGCLGCVWFYLRAAETGRRRDRTLAFVCFALSLLCKPIGVPLPLVLLVLDRALLGRSGRAPWMEKLPYLALSAAVIVITPLAKSSGDSALSLAQHDIPARIAQAARGFWFYPWKTIAPFGLSPIYELHRPLAIATPRYLVPLAGCAALLVLWLVRGRRSRLFTATLLAYGLLVFPLLGFVQSGSQETADRYSYLPAAAFSPVLAAGLLALLRRARPLAGRIAVVAGALALALLAVSSARLSGAWRTSETLWTRAAALEPGSSIAQNGCGWVLYQAGRADEAVARFREALRIMPENEVAHRNLWLALQARGRTDELIADLEQSERIFPRLADVPFHLGNAHARRKEFDAAIDAYRRAIALDPGHAAAHMALGNALEERGDYAAAIDEARQALVLDQRQIPAHLSLARSLWASGDRDAAREALARLLALEPRQPDATKLLRAWESEP